MCSSASTRNINKILSVVFFIVFFGANAYGTDGYIFPDYHRVFMKGLAVIALVLMLAAVYQAAAPEWKAYQQQFHRLTGVFDPPRRVQAGNRTGHGIYASTATRRREQQEFFQIQVR